MPSTPLDLLPHVVVDLHIEDVRHKVKRMLIVLNLGVKAGQIEAVRKIVFIDFAEVLVATRGYELRWWVSLQRLPGDTNARHIRQT